MSKLLGKRVGQATGQKQSAGQSTKPSMFYQTTEAVTGPRHQQDYQNGASPRASSQHEGCYNGREAYNSSHRTSNNGKDSSNDVHGARSNGHGGYNGGYNDTHGTYSSDNGGYNDGRGGYDRGHWLLQQRPE